MAKATPPASRRVRFTDIMFPPYGPLSPIVASGAVTAISRQQHNAMSSRAGLGVALEHFGLEHRPDLAMEMVERRLGLGLGDVARARERPPTVADGACV